MNTNQFNDSRGFTLLEVLVSMAVLGILSAALMQIMVQVNRGINYARTQTRMNGEAGLTANRLRIDLGRVLSLSEPYESNFGSANHPHFLGHNVTGSFTYSGNPSPGGDWVSFHAVEAISDNDAYISDRVLFTILATDAHSSGMYQNDWVFVRNRERHESNTYRYPGNNGRAWSNKGNRDTNPTVDRVYSTQIDFISFQYWDKTSSTWYDDWDSDDTTHGGVDEEGDYPHAVEFAFRVIDPKGTVDPVWYRGMVTTQ